MRSRNCRFCRIPLDNSSTTFDGSWYGRANITTHHNECPKCGSYIKNDDYFASYQSKPNGIVLASKATLANLKNQFIRLKIFDDYSIKESKFNLFNELAYSFPPEWSEKEEYIVVGISENNARIVTQYLSVIESKDLLFKMMESLVNRIPYNWILLERFEYDNTVNWDEVDSFEKDRMYLNLFDNFMIEYIYEMIMVEDYVEEWRK